MNPRKRSKRIRNVPHRLRLPTANDAGGLDSDELAAVEKEATADNLRVLIYQEELGKYTCSDYLSETARHPTLCHLLKKPELDTTRHSPIASSHIDEFCREQIVEWSFRVVDYFRIDREVVALSLSFLDRFLAKCICDRASFKLAATTTLHLAVKLLYPCKLVDLGTLSDLSRGEFNMKDVAEMESAVLNALNWNMNPPTSVAFSSLFLDYFFASRSANLSSTDLDDIYDVSSFFCELSICEYTFVNMAPSAIAVAAMLNALEGMFGPENQVGPEILKACRELGVSVRADLFVVRNRLWELYERSEECALHNDMDIDEKPSDSSLLQGGDIFVKKTTTLSPVSITKACHSSDFVDVSFGHPNSRANRRNGSW